MYVTMESEIIPFSLPSIEEDDIKAVVDCLRSGWLTTGGRTATFEKDFAAFVGGGVEAVAVASATAGLEIALAAHGIGPGDEVITTDYTFTSTAMSAVHVGATPVIVDIDPETFNIDSKKIASAVTQRTKAIIPVHFAGLPCDMQAINAIAKRFGLKVIEDAAHALPARLGNQMIGQATSDATVFSFYATKTITTGEGGMITFRDREAAQRARVLRLHGISKDAFARKNASGAIWHYEVVAPGYKSNMSDILAAMGITQLRRAWQFRERREYLWAAYDEGLAGLAVQLPPKACKGDLHALHLYAIRLRKSAQIERDAFISEMARAGICCSVHFIPLHLHPYWRETLGLHEDMFPQAQGVFERVVSLPLFTMLSKSQQEFIIQTIRTLLV
jgi:dTDP-4-amino-4,6-dideoxygalactose transaminase